MDIKMLSKSPFYLDSKEAEWVSETIGKLTDREKCAQLFNVLGDAYSEDELDRIISELGVGGVLFRPDKGTTVAARFARASELAKVPLLKAANLEEGGAGVITDGTYFANAIQVAAADDLKCAEQYALCCAKEGKEAGVNWTFSPVVDIDMNFRNPITNVRTFGRDPETIINNAEVFIKTIQKYGVAASCKHFPGDGVDYRDQHNHPTYNTLSAQEWYETFGRIYQSAIDAGVLSIMVGHIVQPDVIKDVDPAGGLLPGSQSREMMTGVLREKFGFNGLIITDATLMGGYTMTMKRSQAVPASVMAGADMLCFSTDIYEDVDYLMAALTDGKLTEERLNDAVLRILALKAVLARKYEEPVIDCSEAQRYCAERAVTLVRDSQELLPFRKEQYPHIRLITLGEEDIYDGSLTNIAYQVFTDRGFKVEVFDPETADMHGPGDLPQDRVTLLLCNRHAHSFQTETRINWTGGLSFELPRFVNEEKYAAISFANPYHLQDLPQVKTFINAYSGTRAAIEAAADKLTGISEFTGVSPVDPCCGLSEYERGEVK